MPELSRFLGIIIAMYYRDHNPAHFHAIYGEFEITIELASGKLNIAFRHLQKPPTQPPMSLIHKES